MDMAFLEHRGWERRASRMPVFPNAYPGLPLVLLTSRTLRPLETKKGSRQSSERQANEQPD
jgi:hypothetical protein